MTHRQPLVCQHLENISRDALEQYQDIIREYVRSRHGVYALYRRSKLYYVGLASDLRNRLKSHLKDKHGGSWDRFSVYLTIGDSHLRELESLVLRIVRPKGNRQVGRFARSENLKGGFGRRIRAYYRQQMDEMLGRRLRVAKKQRRAPATTLRRAGRKPALAAYVQSPLKLRARFKRRLIRAQIRRDGSIRFDGKIYKSPSMAAAVACGRRTCNGWSFWNYERAPGDWVSLTALRRQGGRPLH